MKQTISNRIPIVLGMFILILSLNWLIGSPKGFAAMDYRAPEMMDYVKLPPFSSFAVKPNIMIALDNSGSMNYLAYSGDFEGAPYNDLSSISLPLSAAYDDMEESLGGGLRDGAGSGTDLDFGTDYIAVRFQDVNIPQGAYVSSAYIEFTAKYADTDLCEMEISGEAADDADFLDVNKQYNISSRTRTAAGKTWTISTAWSAGATYDSPDLTAIVQEIVNRGGWARGNAMNFILNPIGFTDADPATSTSGHRETWSRERSEAEGPILHVTFFDPTAAVRYYGYFNPDYFYEYGSGVFNPKYKKIKYNYAAANWTVEDLSGGTLTIDDSIISPGTPANGLWDGNWLNWVSMRRVDVLRKVLMGGKATSRTGGGNQQNKAEPSASWRDQSKFFSSSLGPATSPYKGNYTYDITQGYLAVSGTKYTLSIQKDINIEPEDFFEGNLAGILQRIGDRARWGNMWFNLGTGSSGSGGYIANTLDNGFGVDFLPDIQNQACETWTPLAETFYVAMLYYMQEDAPSGYDYVKDTVPNSNDGQDPFYDKDQAEFIPCSKNFVLLLTDGASTKDGMIPSTYKDFDGDGDDGTSCNESTGSGCDYASGGTDYLDDVALYARTQDLRADLEGDQNVYLYTVYAFDDDPNARALLKNAARNGGFEDLNNNGKPDGDFGDAAEDRVEWDKDGDGDPDNYYEASDGYTLEKELLAAINDILKRASSGTAASVISNSRSGEGAIYQSIFYPATTAGPDTVHWVGQVHSLLIDAFGHVREDTNHNKQLDEDTDLYIIFDGQVVQKYQDLEKEPVSEGTIQDINFLWSSNDFLNEITDPVTQRSYGDTSLGRYIFTFVDADGDMVADSGEVKDFTAVTDPTWAEMNDTSNFFAYLHTFEPFTPPAPFTLPISPADADYADFTAMVTRQAARQVNFIRGEDQDFETVGGVNLPDSRNREIDYDGDGVKETWRMGDVVYSTPTLVGTPAEDFDLIYKDVSYRPFYMRHFNRRNMVYLGANDGMVHAFNSGFFDAETNSFLTQPTDDNIKAFDQRNGAPAKTYHKFELGAELWAYVPYNLLPHLYWLQNSDYRHVYYVDLQPRIFDARIYDKPATDPVNPNGWATVMVVGMRFGGGKIAADIDKTDGAYDPAVDKVMSSAYAILDITDPENPPKLLAEITFPDLGFTVCHPGAIPMRDMKLDAEGRYGYEQTNQWYLLFGSGPASQDPLKVSGPNTTALIDGTSDQQAVLYAIDLVELAQNNQLVTLVNGVKTIYTGGAGPYYLYQFPEAGSSISKPIAVDYNLDFNTDAVYFGLNYGDHAGGWNGKMRRLVMDNDSDPTDPTNWTLDSTLIDLSAAVSPAIKNGQPIQAPASIGTDKNFLDTDLTETGDRWVYFGTGRYLSQADGLNDDQQSYYGIKEPYDEVDGTKKFNYGEVDYDNLKNVTGIEIKNNDRDTFDKVVEEVEDAAGWTLDFEYAPGERNIGQAVLAGDLLTFTSYMPTDDLCAAGGESLVYAVYYRSGTAYFKPIFNPGDGAIGADDVLTIHDKMTADGLITTPNIHVGREGGSRVYLQDSTGSITEMEQVNPGAVKSGKLSWKPGDYNCP